MNDVIAGSLSGCLSILICHPIDVLRTKSQTGNNLIGLRQESISTLYRGFLGPFLAQGVYKAVIFSSNSWCKRAVFSNDSSSQSILLSGCFAGCVNSFVVAPVEFCRTQAVLSNTTSLYQFSKLTPGQLFRCLVPTMLRDGPGMAFYLLVFQSLRERSDSSLTNTVLAGCASGVAFWTWALPLDTVKARMESRWAAHPDASAGSPVAATLRSLRREGAWSLYRAWPYAYGRGIPAAAITLTTYDRCIKWLET